MKGNFSNVFKDPILTIESLKESIKAFKNIKILIAITCNPEFYHYLVNLPELKTTTGFNNIFGPSLYIINNQEEKVKYWYNNQKEELTEYLKNNI